MMRTALSAAALWVAIAGAAYARSPNNGGMTLDEVAEVFKDNGFPAETGDQVIYSSTAGFNFALYAYNCGAEGRCNEFLFGASFEPAAAVELSTVNKFNESTLAGRAFLDTRGQPSLEHLFTVENGDAGLVERNLVIWDSILLEFATQIGYVGAGTS